MGVVKIGPVTQKRMIEYTRLLGIQMELNEIYMIDQLKKFRVDVSVLYEFLDFVQDMINLKPWF